MGEVWKYTYCLSPEFCCILMSISEIWSVNVFFWAHIDSALILSVVPEEVKKIYSWQKSWIAEFKFIPIIS